MTLRSFLSSEGESTGAAAGGDQRRYRRPAIDEQRAGRQRVRSDHHGPGTLAPRRRRGKVARNSAEVEH